MRIEQTKLVDFRYTVTQELDAVIKSLAKEQECKKAGLIERLLWSCPEVEAMRIKLDLPKFDRPKAGKRAKTE